MGGRWTRVAAIGFAFAAFSGCSDATGPRHTDVDLARRVWLTSHPGAYTFEVATASSWFPRSGYYHVQVLDGEVVIARDSAGQVVQGFGLTLDLIWEYLLDARTRGELNSATFDYRGVPVEIDMGQWPLDGGVHYSVQSFTRTR